MPGHKKQFFLSLGSNIEPEKNIPSCIESLKKNLSVKKISSIYETDPVGPAGPLKFWNAVVEIESEETRGTLIATVRRIEEGLGRRRNPSDKFAPRPIDIDILPQADYQRHAFIIIPLAEIAPDAHDEETGKIFRDLASEVSERGVKKLAF